MRRRIKARPDDPYLSIDDQQNLVSRDKVPSTFTMVNEIMHDQYMYYIVTHSLDRSV